MKFGKLLCVYGVVVFAALLVVCLVCVRLHRDALKASAPYSVMYEVTAPNLESMEALFVGISYLDPVVGENLTIWITCPGYDSPSGHVAPRPWTCNFTVYGGDLCVAAWSNDEDERGVVTVRIYVDGKIVDEDTGLADYDAPSLSSWRLG